LFERVLKRLREKIRNNEYVVTLHAEEEMTDDGLCVYDVERCILTGKVLERQKDRATGERKYRVRGEGIGTKQMEVLVKIGPTGKLVFITVYAL